MGGVTLNALGKNERQHDVRDQYGTYMTVQVGTRPWRTHIADDIGGDDPLAFVVGCDEYAEWRLAAARRFASTLRNSLSPTTEQVSRPIRAQVVHQATLQALDGQNAGASQREIASAIFGAKLVAKDWTPDSELRARIRYFLRRGRSLVNGGYRRLVYL